jgi:hypothetical protein
MEKRFVGLSARQRYEREYRECRRFNTYKREKDMEFMKSLGDPARLNAFISWCAADERVYESEEQ